MRIQPKKREYANDTKKIINNKEIKTTISLGISQLTQEDYDLDSIIIRADKALYEAKNTGRNKSVIY